MSRNRFDIPVRRGDGWRRQFVVKDRNGDPVDVGGWAVEAAVQPLEGSSVDITAELASDGSDGRLIVTATSAQMATLSWRGHWHVRTDAGDPTAGVEYTIVHGLIEVGDPNG